MKKAQETGNKADYDLAIAMSDQMPERPDDRVPCPYCGRRYAKTVAERHIPRCKDIVNKPKPPPTKVTPGSKLNNQEFDNRTSKQMMSTQ